MRVTKSRPRRTAAVQRALGSMFETRRGFRWCKTVSGGLLVQAAQSRVSGRQGRASHSGCSGCTHLTAWTR
eukprot:6497335-Prymnesium_polylepis.1